MRPFQEAPLGPGPCAPTAGRLSPFSSSFAVFSSGGLHAAAGGCSEDVRSAEKIKHFAIKRPAHALCSAQQEPLAHRGRAQRLLEQLVEKKEA